MAAAEIQCLQMQANHQRKTNPHYTCITMSPEEAVTIQEISWNCCGKALGVSTLVF